MFAESKLWLISQYVNPMSWHFHRTAKPVMCRVDVCYTVYKKHICFWFASHFSITLPANSPNSTVIVGPWWLTPVFSLEFLVSFLLRSTLRQFCGVVKVPVDIRLRAAIVRLQTSESNLSQPAVLQRDACVWKLTGSGWISYSAFIHCINTRNAVVVCLILGKWQRRSAC